MLLQQQKNGTVVCHSKLYKIEIHTEGRSEVAESTPGMYTALVIVRGT